MDYLIILLLIANITLIVMGFRQLKKAIQNGISHSDELTKAAAPKKKELSQEEKNAKKKRELQMRNFFSYTGDKQ